MRIGVGAAAFGIGDRPVGIGYRTIGIGPSAKVPKEMYERESVLAALEEIEADGGAGIDLASLGIDLDLEAADGDGKPEEKDEKK